MVGREQEVGLLFDRWEQVKEGRGQVVLLSGEPGIGKSRLAYTLREHVTSEGSLLFEARCSPYHQHSALYPLIEVLQRTLLLTRQDTDDEKVQKLERALALYNMQETLTPFYRSALLADAITVSAAESHTAETERTDTASAAAIVGGTGRAASDGVGVGRLALGGPVVVGVSVLACRTDSYDQTAACPDLPTRVHPAVEAALAYHPAHAQSARQETSRGDDRESGRRKSLSAEVIEQIRVKTDGVPLFVEELTKSVMESVSPLSLLGLQGRQRTPRQLGNSCDLTRSTASPAGSFVHCTTNCPTGSDVGREFSYELLHAVAPTSEADLQTASTKLVEAEILYQRGVGEQARYFFKHALIQDTAYQSLLKSTRQQYHQQIAQVLEEQFPDTKETNLNSSRIITPRRG